MTPKTAGTKPIELSTDLASSLASNKRKRKREKEKENKRSKLEESKPSGPSKLTKSSKKAEDSEKSKKPIPKKNSKPVVENVDESFAQMDPKLAVDYTSQKLRKFQKDLSAIELEDQYIPESAFYDTTTWRNGRMLEHLPGFLGKFADELPSEYRLSESSSIPGSPHTLIITASAIRATHVIRAVRKYQTKDSIIAKLFAKHIKVEESIDLCNKVRMGIAVGTPGRILEVARNGALKITELRRIVLDMSSLNEKKQSIFDIKETNQTLMDFLNENAVKSRLGEDVHLLVY